MRFWKKMRHKREIGSVSFERVIQVQQYEPEKAFINMKVYSNESFDERFVLATKHIDRILKFREQQRREDYYGRPKQEG
jgi:hypothetical protein